MDPTCGWEDPQSHKGTLQISMDTTLPTINQGPASRNVLLGQPPGSEVEVRAGVRHTRGKARGHTRLRTGDVEPMGEGGVEGKELATKSSTTKM